jgi:outer membrane protein assembly factor BamB
MRTLFTPWTWARVPSFGSTRRQITFSATSPSAARACIFSTRDQKVWGVKPDGTLGRSWPPANNPVGASLGSPVVSAEVVYVADGNGNFYAFNALDGTLAWHITLTNGPLLPVLKMEQPS